MGDGEAYLYERDDITQTNKKGKKLNENEDGRFSAWKEKSFVQISYN